MEGCGALTVHTPMQMLFKTTDCHKGCWTMFLQLLSFYEKNASEVSYLTRKDNICS